MDTNVRFRDLTVDQFVSLLASAEPVPGGGSAAAVAGSLGGALVAMVASLSVGRPKFAEHEQLLTEARAAGLLLADRFLTLADEDAAAFAGFGVAMKMPRDTEEEKAARAKALQAAARAATEAPYRTVEACLQLALEAESMAGRSNKNASSDLEVAGLMAVAAARSAAANVFINVPAMGDDATAQDMLARTEEMVDGVERLASRIREIVRGGETRPPAEMGTA
ncbi:MAG: cyclodeaminase/cyclohydrolase family protein [Candidatus Limnocylindrales bacterium]